MKAVLKHELKAYFCSPIGYVFLGAFFFFSGFFFFNYNLLGNTTDMSSMFEMLFTVTLFLVPILTMRIISEDKKTKTIQLLFIMPIGDCSIILGKFLAAALIFLFGLSSVLFGAIVLSFFAKLQWAIILGNFLGLYLLGITLISIGLLISTLTESQVVSGIGGLSVSLLLIIMQSVSRSIPIKALSSIIGAVAFEPRYTPFVMGIFSFPSVFFFLSITAFFVFLSTLAIKKGR